MTTRHCLRILPVPRCVGVAPLVAVLALTSAACARQSKPTGNVVLISIDTLRADHLGCYGYGRDTSPFLDELADRGVLFEHAIVQVPGTLPSHMSMLTGLLPAEHDVRPPDGALSPKIRTLAERLLRRGVRTAGFTEGGYVSGRYGFDRGFELFDDSHRSSNTDIEDVFRRGLDFVRSLGPSEPFFLFLHTYAVHDPYFPPPPYCGYYIGDPQLGDRSAAFEPIGPQFFQAQEKPSGAGLRERKFLFAQEFVTANLPSGAPLPTGPMLSAFNRQQRQAPAEAIEAYEAFYDGTINYVDDILRAFVDQLEAVGVASSTTIIITSDHGEEFLEHGRLAHEQVYNECLHVPLIAVGPGLAPGRIRDLVMSIDITPTVLGLFGISSSQPMTGQDLGSALHRPPGESIERRDAHAVAIVDPVESLYRLYDGAPYQLVVHDPRLREKAPWVERDITLYPQRRRVEFEAMSYHEPREVAVSVDSMPWARLSLAPEWRPFTIELPNDGRGHVVTMVASDCVSPSDLGESSDRRCLAFRIRGFDSRRTELYDLATDPAAANDLSPGEDLHVRDMLDGLSFFHRQPVAAAQRITLDAADEDRLKALGYLQ